MGKESKKLCIIRIHKNDEEVRRLKKLLQEKGYSIRETVADPPDPPTASNKKESASKNLDAIVWCEVVLVLISPDMSEDESVDKEIKIAFEQGKRIIGVYISSGSMSDIPKNFEKFGVALVTLVEEQLISAICGDLNEWYKPNGEPKKEPRKIKHFECK